MNNQSEFRFNPEPVEMWMAHEFAAKRLESCVLEVHHAKECVYTSELGIANSYGEPTSRDTVYWIASMTKPIVSVAAMRLVENGVLSLGSPVSDFIPGFGQSVVLTASGDPEPLRRPPTLLDLLTHTSGVTYGLFGEDDIHRQYTDAKVYDFRSDNARMAERLAKLPLLHQPGTVFEYGMSTDLVGRVIELLTGRPLDEALHDLVLAPLDMKTTTFMPDPRKMADIPASPLRASIAPLFSEEQTWWSGGAGLCSTIGDYMRFAQMLLNGGTYNGVQILREESVALMRQNHLPDGVKFGSYTEALGITAPWPQNGLGFGLGFAVRTQAKEDLPGGKGEFFWPGASGANFWVDPRNDLVVVFLTHAPTYRVEHRVELRNAVYQGLNEKVLS